MGLTAEDRRIIADKDRALSYCQAFYQPRLNALNDMGYAAHTAATTFLSKMTEPQQQRFITAASEALFLSALGLVPGAVPLTKFWRALEQNHPFFAERAKDLLSQVPPALLATAKITAQPQLPMTRTTILRTSLVKVGEKLSKGRNFVLKEWLQARATVLYLFERGDITGASRGRKVWLQTHIQKVLGMLPTWRNIQKPLTDAYEKELFRSYVAKFVEVSGPESLGPQWQSGLSSNQFEYLQRRFGIRGVRGLLGWGASYREIDDHPATW